MDSVPPERSEERAFQRRGSQSDIPAVGAVVGKIKDPTVRLAQLERELATERAERTAEADLMGQILARATQAEARVSLLEQSLARANEERAIAEGQLQSARAELDRFLADTKASFDANNSLLPSPVSDRRFQSRPQLHAARALAAELLHSIDAALGNEPASQRPRVPTLRPKAGRP
jgi:chromosome segregation ATPase